jgi:cell division protein ZipA
MSSELRWILLILGVLFIAALAVWERRRPRQASASSATERPAPRDVLGDSAPRARQEPRLILPEMSAERHGNHQLPVIEFGEAEPETDEVPVLAAIEAEPSGSFAESDPEEADLPPAAAMPAHAQAAAAPAEPASTRAAADLAYVPKISTPAQPAALRAVADGAPGRDAWPGLPPAEPPLVEWPPDEERQIVALRLVAAQPQRFAGRSLRQALAAEGFVLGRFAIFHKPDEAHRAVLSAASLNRPGTFDADTMDSQHFGGLSLFAVLPGPKSPPQAFDELVFTARSLNERLHGVLQDEQGGPLTPARIASLRERLNGGAGA